MTCPHELNKNLLERQFDLFASLGSYFAVDFYTLAKLLQRTLCHQDAPIDYAHMRAQPLDYIEHM